MHFILISGKRCVGKDAVAKILKDNLSNSKIEGFSYVVKKLFCKENGLDYERMLRDYDYKTQHRMGIREFVQRKFKEEGDLFCVEEFIKEAEKNVIYIVPDNRFKRECEFFKENFPNQTTLVRVEALDENRKQRGWVYSDTTDNNSFENELDDYNGFDNIINNNSHMKDLYRSINGVVTTVRFKISLNELKY